jgi:hypothetical protein
MSLMQLPKVIDAVNELATKVQKLELQVQSLLAEKNKVTVVEEPLVNKKPTLKKND